MSVIYRNHEHAKLRRLAVESHEILRELQQLQVVEEETKEELEEEPEELEEEPEEEPDEEPPRKSKNTC